MTRNGQYNLPGFTPTPICEGTKLRRTFKAVSNGFQSAPSKRKLVWGFTLVEVVIVLIILAILAAIAVPLYTSTASIQLKTAANMIASDLEYAKSMAMSTGRNYSVVFDTSTESYSIKDVNNQIISHPVHIGANYVVSFANDSRLNKVIIESAKFNSTKNGVRFDYLGVPYAWDGSSASFLDSGSVLLSAEGDTLTVRVEPVTGYISIE
jgi:prepilin-type N-terminal cleavage/methylation domain-containing protein